jgi:predicted DNA-binding transcriptional regulator AlpA
MSEQEMKYMGVSEASEYLGISRAAVLHRVKRGNFPKPLAKLSMGYLWLEDDIKRFREIRVTDENAHEAR